MTACYVCALLIEDGDKVVVLREDDGTEWVIHEPCLEQMEEVGDACK